MIHRVEVINNKRDKAAYIFIDDKQYAIREWFHNGEADALKYISDSLYTLQNHLDFFGLEYGISNETVECASDKDELASRLFGCISLALATKSSNEVKRLMITALDIIKEYCNE